MDLGLIIFSIFVGFVIALILRPFMHWYWKVNVICAYLKGIHDRLDDIHYKMIINSPDKDTEDTDE